MSTIKVHKFTLMVLDFEGSDPSEVAYARSNHRHFPASVMTHDVAETEWDGDDHPLNQQSMTAKPFDRWMKKNGAVSVLPEQPQ